MNVQKQSLVYESAVPVSKQRHADFCVDMANNYNFSRDINAVPIVVGEFAKIAREYPIVFVNAATGVIPMAMVGLRDNENLFLSPEGSWDGDYVPAFIRRYPFVFSKKADDDSFVLCIDEKCDGINSEGRGQALFKDDGEASEYLEKMLAFTTTFQATERFASRLADLDILRPAEINFQLSDGKKAKTGGLLGGDRDRLSELDPEQLAELQKSGDLELIYTHLFSSSAVEGFSSRLR